jgi:predicted nucleic acid-binding protein
MNGSLLDTNVITKVLDKDPAALRMVEKVEKLYTSSIVAGELYFAALNSTRVEANFNIFRKALFYMEIIPVDAANWIATQNYFFRRLCHRGLFFFILY